MNFVFISEVDKLYLHDIKLEIYPLISVPALMVRIANLSAVLGDLEKLKTANISKALAKSADIVATKAKRNVYGTDFYSEELDSSIQTRQEQNRAEIYSDSKAAWWAEYGTGHFAENGDGRPGWWVWVDPECGAPKSTHRIIYSYEEAEECAASLSKLYGESHVHVTQGVRATRFMRDALDDSIPEILEAFKEEITNG